MLVQMQFSVNDGKFLVHEFATKRAKSSYVQKKVHLLYMVPILYCLIYLWCNKHTVVYSAPFTFFHKASFSKLFSPTRPHWAELVIGSPCPSVCLFFVCGFFLEKNHATSDQKKLIKKKIKK